MRKIHTVEIKIVKKKLLCSFVDAKIHTVYVSKKCR